MTLTGDVTDTRVQAAKALLCGQGRMAAKAQDLTPVQAARDRFGTDALDADERAQVDDGEGDGDDETVVRLHE